MNCGESSFSCNMEVSVTNSARPRLTDEWTSCALTVVSGRDRVPSAVSATTLARPFW
jgi:hypothetical protein